MVSLEGGAPQTEAAAGSNGVCLGEVRVVVQHVRHVVDLDPLDGEPARLQRAVVVGIDRWDGAWVRVDKTQLGERVLHMTGDRRQHARRHKSI